MNALLGLCGTLLLFLLAGSLIGLANRGRFAPRWLLVSVILVAINDALLTRAYGTLPNLFAGSDWNWEGKLLALAATFAIAALPAFGWRNVGATLAQASGSLRASLPVALLYCGFFIVIALIFPNGPASREDVAFQLTMPGLEEELFYRGLLLFALDRAFTGRIRFLGVDWGWGAVLSCLLFGLAHGFGYSDGQFSLDTQLLALTALPSFIAVWLRLRTGSLIFPVFIHNLGNALMLLI